MTVKRTFTFGQGQELAGYGLLRDHYVEIEGETIEHCRATMLNHFGREWAFEYESLERATRGGEYDMVKLPRVFWPPYSYEWYVDDETGSLVMNTRELQVKLLRDEIASLENKIRSGR